MTGRPILIAGAGIGGLTLAIALAQRGIFCTVLERAATLEEIGAGLQLSPNASRVLDALGLGPALDEAGVEPRAIRLLDGRTARPIAELPLADARKRWGAPYRLIHRAALQRILVSAATEAGADLRLGHELKNFSDTDDGVTVQIATPDGPQAMSGALLVGADGVRSFVRTRMNGDLRFSGQVAWRALLPSGSGSDTEAWLGPGAHFVTYLIDKTGARNLVAVTHGRAGADGWSQPGERNELLRAFAGWAEPVRRLIAAADEWVCWPLYDGAVTHGDGPVTLIGDAAHPVLPHLAQGAALAIEDAAVLAARLTAMPDDSVLALRTYEALRKERTARVQTEARRNGEIFRMRVLPALARDAALRMMGPERLLARYDWLYGYRAG